VSEQRVAIVTGGARGIGAAVAKRLARDGFAVGVLDLDEASTGDVVKAIESEGGKALGVGVDVADAAAVETAVERVAAELGPPVVLINNAGITRDNMLFKMSVEDWDAVINVHLRGQFLMTRATQKYMTQAKWGRIVNLSSTSALGNRGQVNYSAAKGALNAATRALSIELASRGITVNAVAPGLIATKMIASAAAADIVDRMVPMKRVGQPAEVADLVAFLASDSAAYISGQVISINGGML